MVKLIIEGQHPLAKVFKAALEQVTKGKGEKLHGHGEAEFFNQPWRYIAQTLGQEAGVGFLVGQAMKKSAEAVRNYNFYKSDTANKNRFKLELLGAINYLGMAVLLEDEKDKANRIITEAEILHWFSLEARKLCLDIYKAKAGNGEYKAPKCKKLPVIGR